MRRRAFVKGLALGLPLTLAAGAASAQAKQAGQYVDLAPAPLPIVVNGRLVNYVFVYIRINLAAGADTPRWRDKEPYFRDALVRLAHRTPFTWPGDYTRIDQARLRVALYQAVIALTGPGVVSSVEILPGGGPMRRTGLPRAGALVTR